MRLIIEPSHLGHRLEYVEYIARHGNPDRLSTHLITTYETFQAIQNGRSGELTNYVDEIVIKPPSDPIFSSSKELSEFATTIKARIVVVPDGDAIIYQIGMRRRWNSRAELYALILRSPWVSPNNFARDQLKKLLISRATSVPHVHIRHLTGAFIPPTPKLKFVQDCSRWSKITFRPDSLNLELDPSRFWYGIFGDIDKRKNIGRVATALIIDNPKATGLLIAGKIESDLLRDSEPTLKDYLDSGGKVIVLDRYLMESEIDWLVANVNCVVCVYSNEGPSGLFMKAAAAGQLILTSRSRALRNESLEYEGATWVPNGEIDLAKGLRAVRNLRKPARRIFGTPEKFGWTFGKS